MAAGLVSQNPSKDSKSPSLLDALYQSNVIPIILSTASSYSDLISPKYVTFLLNILSELVLTSSKFLTQVY